MFEQILSSLDGLTELERADVLRVLMSKDSRLSKVKAPSGNHNDGSGRRSGIRYSDSRRYDPVVHQSGHPSAASGKRLDRHVCQFITNRPDWEPRRPPSVLWRL